MKKIVVIVVMLSLGFYISVKAQNVKIWPIVFCNTNDENIGASCDKDKERFVRELGIIEAALGKGCEVDWMNFYTGEECSKPNLESVISGLRCGTNDVIIFYYSGHGVHAKTDDVSGWLPQMCLKYQSYDQDKFVPVKTVRDKLLTKNARLVIILTDCCNDEKEWATAKGLIDKDGGSPKLDAINVEYLKKLFCSSKGTVVATSSKRNQVSLGLKSGGLFSISFWDEIYRIEQGQGTPNWKSLMEATKERTMNKASSFNAKQEPVCEVNVDGDNEVIINNNNNNDNNNNGIVVISLEQELSDAFKKIVNNSYSKNDRLAMIDGIVQRLFASDAKVIMVGRNLETKIGLPMPISKYLEELALSKTVKGVNIVRAGKNSTGKFTQITISEIR